MSSIPPAGPALTPLQIVRQVRWFADVTPDQIVAAIRSAEHLDIERLWPEVDAAELRKQCRTMSKSRLRAWMEGRERQPTWLEVRALLSGLHEMLK